MKTLEDLEAWKLCRELRKLISSFAKELPKHEHFRLGDQMIRASRSVTANIAEGYGRFHFQENIQFCRDASGSLIELLDHFTVALDEKYLSEIEFNDYKGKIYLCTKVLNGYILYLKNAKEQK